jgi:hypothetical protein
MQQWKELSAQHVEELVKEQVQLLEIPVAVNLMITLYRLTLVDQQTRFFNRI